MRRPFDRFLRHGIATSRSRPLGRNFSVTRESWALSDDPVVKRPRRQALTAGKTASDAAEAARAAAQAYPEHGFHKPSGAWWASDGNSFYRFLVRAGPERNPAALLVAGVAAGLGIALLRRGDRRPKR